MKALSPIHRLLQQDKIPNSQSIDSQNTTEGQPISKDDITQSTASKQAQSRHTDFLKDSSQNNLHVPCNTVNYKTLVQTKC